ncbi:MAG: hypothetical protein M3Y71_05490 [Actinomycetota bacterium]|nr:hypothetical protein [Actinomycetota bacterium]
MLMNAAGVVTAGVDPPRVSGRHRNHALASARHARAIRLVTDGRTYQQVADDLGYSNRGTVHRLCARPSRETVDSVSELRRLEGDRLDALLRSVWDQAMAGDVAAIRTATDIVMAREKLFGLEGAGTPPTTAGRTVVLLP